MNHNTKKNDSRGKLIGLLLVLVFTMPQLLLLIIPVAIVAGIGYAIAKNKGQSGTTPRQSQVKDITYTKSSQCTFDECPKSAFSFHKDRGAHHVARGKELDPWDRPDIDISKYQRRG